MKGLALLAALALAACSEPAPPPRPVPQPRPKTEAEAPKAAPAPLVAAEPAEAKAPEAPPDPNKELALRVRQALDAPASRLPSGAIDVTAKDGKVTLWGALPSEHDVARASDVARKIPGVKAIDNQLKVVRGS